MTQNIRGEYYSKEEDAHYMYRLFCVPKGQPLPKKLIFRFDKYSIECDVNNIPKIVKVTRIDKMEPQETSSTILVNRILIVPSKTRKRAFLHSLFRQLQLYNLRKLMIFDIFSQLIGVFSEKYRIFAPSLKES